MAKEILITEKTLFDRLILSDGGNTKPNAKKVGVFYSSGSMCGNEQACKKLALSIKNAITQNDEQAVLVPFCTINPLFLAINQNTNYSVVQTKNIVAQIESVNSLLNFDAFVFVPFGEDAINACLEVAIKINNPTLMLNVGNNAPIFVDGKNYTQSSLFLLNAMKQLGHIDDKKFKTLAENYMPNLSEGEGLTVGNALSCAIEALGISLATNGTCECGSMQRMNLAYKTGEVICKMINDQMVIRKVLSKANFLNAISVMLAIGAPVSTLVSIQKFAKMCGYEINNNTLFEISNKTPLIAKIFPNSEFYMRDLYAAGGVKAIMKSLSLVDAINLRGVNYYAESIENEIIKSTVFDDLIIHNSKTNPIIATKPICLLKGNVAEEIAFLNRASIFPGMNGFSGYAKAFNTEEEACRSVYAGRIKKGDVVIIKNQGDKGAPGLNTVHFIQAAIEAAGLSKDVAIITDGNSSCHFANIIVSNIKPESYMGEDLALVYDDDIVDIDIEDNKVNAKISAKDISMRRRNFMPFVKNNSNNYEKYLK